MQKFAKQKEEKLIDRSKVGAGAMLVASVGSSSSTLSESHYTCMRAHVYKLYHVTVYISCVHVVIHQLIN